MMLARLPLLMTALLLGACQSAADEPASPPSEPAPSSAAPATPSGEARIPATDGAAPDEEINLTGTEPFWGGSIDGAQFTYKTPENQDGVAVTVSRFKGLNGVNYSGVLEGRTFDLALTEAPCSDGMSDRKYPYTATLRFPEETRNGCAWSASRPFSGPINP